MVNDKHWSDVSKALVGKTAIEESQCSTLTDMIHSPDIESFNLAKKLVRLKLSDVLVQGLNEEQGQAFVNIIDFFKSTDIHAFVLKGFGGTGKTFLINRLIEYINIAHPSHKIAITAPTNKAIHVLSEYGSYKNAVFEDYGRPSGKIVYCTIHKLLNLKESIDNEGNVTFVSEVKNGEDILSYRYVFVDEVSMLSDSLFLSLMKYKDKIKLLFIGDPAQICPVKQIDFYLFAKERDKNPRTTMLLGETPLNFSTYSLTQIMRQKGEHPVVATSMKIRNNLDKVFPAGKLKTTLNKKGDGIVHIDAKTNRKAMRSIIETYYKSENYTLISNYVKILAWTNATVRSLNKIVRGILFGEHVDKFVVSERLVADKALFSRTPMKGKSNCFMYSVKANTADEFTVKEVSVQDVRFRECQSASLFDNLDVTLKCWVLKATANGTNQIILNIIHDDSIPQYTEILNNLKKVAKSKKLAAYWGIYYNVVKWNDAVLYDYALSIHKSQGSQYQNVMLIEEDVDHNPRLIERNRIKYTAYTRTVNRLYVLK
jgi:hypothetical protein